MILFLCLLLQRARRQRGNLFVKQLLGPSPHRRVLPVVEGEQRGQEVIYFCFVSITHVVLRRVGGELAAKSLRRLPWQKRREVVNRNHRKRRSRREALDGNGGLVECSRDGVDRHWGKGGGGVG